MRVCHACMHVTASVPFVDLTGYPWSSNHIHRLIHVGFRPRPRSSQWPVYDPSVQLAHRMSSSSGCTQDWSNSRIWFRSLTQDGLVIFWTNPTRPGPVWLVKTSGVYFTAFPYFFVLCEIRHFTIFWRFGCIGEALFYHLKTRRGWTRASKSRHASMVTK